MSQARGEGPGRVTHGRGSRTWGDGGSLGGGLFAGGWGTRVSATQVVKVVGQRAKGATGSLSSRTRWRWPRRDCPAAQPLQERMHRPDHRIFQSETWLDVIQLGAAAPPPWRLGPCFQERLTPPSRCPSVATGWGGGRTPGSRGPQPGGADCPHPYPRGPAAGHLTPQLWTELPSTQGRETPHTRTLHPPEALQDPTSDPALANAPFQGHQGRLTPPSGTPARRPSWGSPAPAPLQRPLCHSGAPRTLAC